jgi:hypothetical protein
MVLNKSWLFAAIPLAVIALALLALTAISLLRTVRRSVVVSVPMRADQTVTFKDAGSYVLNVEGTSLSRVAAGLSFAITKEGSGTSIPLHRILVRTKVSSFSRTRLGLYGFDIPAPGVYTLRMTGMDSSTNYDSGAIVITRPFTLALVTHVLALVTLGALFIGSLVITGLVLSKRPLSSGGDNGVGANQGRPD